MWRRVFIAATVSLSFSVPAFAQNIPVCICGPITKIDGRKVTAINRDWPEPGLRVIYSAYARP